MSDHIIPIEKQDFFPNVVRKKMDGWRFAQMCAVRTEDGYELSYTFVNGPDMDTLRLELEKEEPIVSITQVYPCAKRTKRQSCSACASKASRWIINTNCIASIPKRRLRRKG